MRERWQRTELHRTELLGIIDDAIAGVIDDAIAHVIDDAISGVVDDAIACRYLPCIALNNSRGRAVYVDGAKSTLPHHRLPTSISS